MVFMPHVGISVEYNNHICLLHFEYLHKLTPSTVRFLSWYIPWLDEFVKDMGYDGLWGVVPEDNKIVNKLCPKMGMEFIENKDAHNVYKVGED